MVGLGGSYAAAREGIAWNGREFAVAYAGGNYAGNLKFRKVFADGTPDGAAGTGGFVVAWMDYHSGTHYDIWTALVYGTEIVNYVNDAVAESSSSYHAYYPHLATAPGFLGLAWDDNRSGNYDIYFDVLNFQGCPQGSPLQLTTNTADQYLPYVCWTGSEFGVFWADYRANGNLPQVWFQRVSAGGALQGSNVQATNGMDALYPAAAFAKLGYLVVGDANQSQSYAEAFGCNYPYPPPCPSNVVAYGVTGTSATISWLPSSDPYTDIAYYQLYRNSQPLVQTASTYYTDGTLTAGTTYQYAVEAVNAADLVSSACGSTNSIYVKTNASLTLMVNKQAPDAILSWTDSQPLNSCNVFRGTRPQVMQQIGTASGSNYSDPGVMNDSVLYFYTVDDPGQ